MAIVDFGMEEGVRNGLLKIFDTNQIARPKMVTKFPALANCYSTG